jgi:hypothetical protein
MSVCRGSEFKDAPEGRDYSAKRKGVNEPNASLVITAILVIGVFAELLKILWKKRHQQLSDLQKAGGNDLNICQYAFHKKRVDR